MRSWSLRSLLASPSFSRSASAARSHRVCARARNQDPHSAHRPSLGGRTLHRARAHPAAPRPPGRDQYPRRRCRQDHRLVAPRRRPTRRAGHRSLPRPLGYAARPPRTRRPGRDGQRQTQRPTRPQLRHQPLHHPAARAAHARRHRRRSAVAGKSNFPPAPGRPVCGLGRTLSAAPMSPCSSLSWSRS